MVFYFSEFYTARSPRSGSEIAVSVTIDRSIYLDHAGFVKFYGDNMWVIVVL